MAYSKPVEVRWSDLDPNFHLRHSVYYDWGAYCRMSYFSDFQLTNAVLQQLQKGPILFREECVFRREIHFGDSVTIDLELVSARRDYSRWSIRHQIMTAPDQLAAVLTVTGAWMDLQLRKLTLPPPQAAAVFAQVPKAADFIWMGPGN